MKIRSVPAAIALLVLLSACADMKGFEDSDPEAHSACTKFLEEELPEGNAELDDPLVALGTTLIVGEHAANASTPEIQAVAEEVTGTGQYLIDEAALISVCEDNGYEVSTGGSLAELWQSKNA